MFNPQRKSKINDIYMQEKWYQMHIMKLRKITSSSSPQKQRQRQEKEQQNYLKRLSSSKQEVNQRIHNNIKQSNHKLFLKLLSTDTRKENNLESDYFKNKKKHFNWYYSSKKELQRVKLDNHTLVTRMMNSQSEVPTLRQCKQQHKKNKQHVERCRKLPSIFQHESQFKKKFSKRYILDESKTKSRIKSSRISSHLKLSRHDTEEKQMQLLSKQISTNLLLNSTNQK